MEKCVEGHLQLFDDVTGKTFYFAYTHGIYSWNPIS